LPETRIRSDSFHEGLCTLNRHSSAPYGLDSGPSGFATDEPVPLTRIAGGDKC
jgi:hypothetical protein